MIGSIVFEVTPPWNVQGENEASHYNERGASSGDTLFRKGAICASDYHRSDLTSPTAGRPASSGRRITGEAKMKRLIAGALIVCVTIVLVGVAISRHVAHKQAVEWCHENGYANYATTDGFCVGAGGKLVKVGAESASHSREF
jgi:hypothetical protein